MQLAQALKKDRAWGSRAGWVMAIRPGCVMGIAQGERGLALA